MAYDTISNIDAIIIGSGFAGICQAIEFKKNGIHDFLILEKESDLGGTWRDNKYPGAACDIPTALYSFSFERVQTHTSHLDHMAMLEYIRKVAVKYGILQHIRFGQRVESMVFVEDGNAHDMWEVNVNTSIGESTATRCYGAKIVVTAVGQLHYPRIPNFPGLDDFKGEIIHTAQFGKRGKGIEDYRGKKVAIIGSGASAIQILPDIQKVCEEVHLYVRTPNYILPRITLSRVPELIITSVPFLWRMYRQFLPFMSEMMLLNAVRGIYLAQNTVKFLASINMRLFLDASMRKALTPCYPAGARRVLFSNTFWPAVVQPNVFVNVSGIKCFSDDGVLASDESLAKIDTIICATGFITNPFLFGINVMGRSKKQLWKEEEGEENKCAGYAHAYLGIATRGFPNLFFMYGPNTNAGSNSVILFFEEQAKFITRAFQFLQNQNHKSIEVKAEVEYEFNRELLERSKGLAWTKIKSSWYLAKGKNVSNWVGCADEYSERLAAVDIVKDFEIHKNGEQEASVDGCGELSYSRGGKEEKNKRLSRLLFEVPFFFVKVPFFFVFFVLIVGNMFLELAWLAWRSWSLGRQNGSNDGRKNKAL